MLGGGEPAQDVSPDPHPDAHGWMSHLIDWIAENQIVTGAIVLAFSGACATLWYCVKRIIDHKFPKPKGES